MSVYMYSAVQGSVNTKRDKDIADGYILGIRCGWRQWLRVSSHCSSFPEQIRLTGFLLIRISYPPFACLDR